MARVWDRHRTQRGGLSQGPGVRVSRVAQASGQRQGQRGGPSLGSASGSAGWPEPWVGAGVSGVARAWDGAQGSSGTRGPRAASSVQPPGSASSRPSLTPCSFWTWGLLCPKDKPSPPTRAPGGCLWFHHRPLWPRCLFPMRLPCPDPDASSPDRLLALGDMRGHFLHPHLPPTRPLGTSVPPPPLTATLTRTATPTPTPTPNPRSEAAAPKGLARLQLGTENTPKALPWRRGHSWCPLQVPAATCVCPVTCPLTRASILRLIV